MVYIDYGWREWTCGCGTVNRQKDVPRTCTNCGTPRGAMTPKELEEYSKTHKDQPTGWQATMTG